MANYTSNYLLTKPAYTDTADIADINGNMDKVDTALHALGGGLAIMSYANQHAAISKDQYVYIYMHANMAEGLYKALSNISANATLNSSNVQAVSGGLGSAITTLSDQIASIGEYISTTEGSTNVTNESATKIAEIKPSAGRWLLIANISFPSSATGSRTASLSTDSSLDSAWWQSVQASPYGSTGLQVMRFATFDGTNSIKLVVRQTSGSTQSVTHRIFAIKLHE